MNEQPINLYCCDICEETYESRFDAEDCCKPVVFSKPGWKCECGTTYTNKEDAHGCCWDGETELESYIPTPAEMEAAGQARLPL